MRREHEAEDRALADRLVNYADAIAAFCFLALSGFGIAVADPDIQSTIARARSYVIAGNLVAGLLFTGIVVALRRWEQRLRSDSPRSEAAQLYSRYLHWARLSLVLVSSALVIVIAVAVG